MRHPWLQSRKEPGGRFESLEKALARMWAAVFERGEWGFEGGGFIF